MRKKQILIALAILAGLIYQHWLFGEGELVSFQTYSNHALYVGCKAEAVMLFELKTKEDKEYTTFRLVPGLADGKLVSLQSALQTNYFMRHQGGQLKLHGLEDDGLFKSDATFRKVAGLADPSDPTLVSFESFNYPGFYIRHRNGLLYIEKSEASVAYKQDATFRIQPPNWDGNNATAKIAPEKKPMLEPSQYIGLGILFIWGCAFIGLSIFFTIMRDRKKRAS
jgi:hypothetical protein